MRTLLLKLFVLVASFGAAGCGDGDSIGDTPGGNGAGSSGATPGAAGASGKNGSSGATSGSTPTGTAGVSGGAKPSTGASGMSQVGQGGVAGAGNTPPTRAGASGRGGFPVAGGGAVEPPGGTAGSGSGTSGRVGSGSSGRSGRGGEVGVSGTSAGVTGAVSGGASGTTPTTGSAGGGTEKFLGNITTSNNSMDFGGKTYSKHWNQVTPENAGKWGSVQSSPTATPNWAGLDGIYDYAKKNNVIFKQHAFIWGSQQPSNAGSITEAQVKKWMKDFCTRYPETKLIDVVNEPPPHTKPDYRNNIGGGDDSTWAWIANSFKWAREACPNAILILNDYNNIEWDTDNKHMVSIVQAIKKLDAPIDAIGCQAHDLDINGGKSLDEVKKYMENLHSQTSLPIYITEMDISTKDDAAQLALYQRFFPYFMGLDYVKGVTIWGWIVGRTWNLAPDSGLVNANGASRPAMKYIMEQVGRPVP